MGEVPWGSPAIFGRMTIPQLMALIHERPPGAPRPLGSAEDVVAMLTARAEAEARWNQ